MKLRPPRDPIVQQLVRMNWKAGPHRDPDVYRRKEKHKKPADEPKKEDVSYEEDE